MAEFSTAAVVSGGAAALDAAAGSAAAGSAAEVSAPVALVRGDADATGNTPAVLIRSGLALCTLAHTFGRWSTHLHTTTTYNQKTICARFMLVYY
jgi:hypothetical protein